MEQKIVIQKVNQLDTASLMLLVGESSYEGFRHVKRLVNDYEDGANKFDEPGEALFIAYQHDNIVGVCGLNRDPYSNNKDVGRARRLYVSPRARRSGIARMLMDSVVAEATKHYKMLVLKTHNPIADAFYRSIGFSVDCDSENNSHFLRLERHTPSDVFTS
ncbi:GNAT family N-acetyltransferase [Paenibacillus xerothermodurans]|uniref:N-acetyltransferase n=1 Tax=Paenibacillus xerothermodurans TaxID=1977292 RepID=A0A2W1NU97_PAEXE|nr:GNAT family N-acetyltransferase [Paenibacillus xerothermodurans]PZE22233.1 N-acetyltransferase [Paenibacillus xerothermodurans]